MRFLRLLSLSSALLVATSHGLGQRTADTPAGRDKQAADAKLVSNSNADFCMKDPRAEIKAFCPLLVRLRDARRASLTHDPMAAQQDKVGQTNTLNILNPASPLAINYVIAVMRLRQISQITQADIASALQAANQVRTDQQLGATASTSGTTSLIAKAGSAELLSLAVDTGALTKSVNGSTTTLSTNADQLFRLITGYQPDCLMNCQSHGKFEQDVLAPLNLAATFSLAQSSTSDTATSGQASGTTAMPVSMVAIPTGAGKLTSITAKFQLLNKFDPRSQTFQTAWHNQIATLTPSAIQVANDARNLFGLLSQNGSFKTASNLVSPSATQTEIDAANLADSSRNNLLWAAAVDPSGAPLVAAFENLWSAAHVDDALAGAGVPALEVQLLHDRETFRDAWATAVANTTGTMLSLQYTFNKPLNQPPTHDVTGIYGHSWGTSGSITVNGGVSLYHGALPAGANYGRVHYGQFSGEYDRNLANPTKSIQTQITLAGYWQYQPQASVLNIPAGTVAPGTNIPLPNGTQEFVGTPGSLWVTQGKFTIKGPSGVNIPIGVSWSNKTDLIQGSKVGAQVGISYNFSTLAGLF